MYWRCWRSPLAFFGGDGEFSTGGGSGFSAVALFAAGRFWWRRIQRLLLAILVGIFLARRRRRVPAEVAAGRFGVRIWSWRPEAKTARRSRSGTEACRGRG